jgi:hypothetical protein
MIVRRLGLGSPKSGFNRFKAILSTGKGIRSAAHIAEPAAAGAGVVRPAEPLAPARGGGQAPGAAVAGARQGAAGAQEDHAQREGQAGTQAKEDLSQERQLSKKDLEDAGEDRNVVCDRSDKSDQKMSLELRSLKSLRSHSLTAESIVACSHVAFHVVPGEFDGDPPPVSIAPSTMQVRCPACELMQYERAQCRRCKWALPHPEVVFGPMTPVRTLDTQMSGLLR